VILRGQNGSVSTVYLVRFDRSIFTGGGVQYQQTMDNPGGAAAGWFDFVSCVLEWSGSPLLDLQSDPSLAADVQGLEQVVISDYMNADNTDAHYGAGGGAPVVAVNCTQRRCGIDGLAVDMAGYDSHGR
jgi:hypothetical protein